MDAVVIASPPEHHKDQIIALLQAGKAVLVEKPMCISPEEIVEIETALERDETPLLMIAENYYYKPSLSYIKHMIAQSDIGDMRSVSVKKLTTQQAQGWKSAHGALLEGGIHFIALIQTYSMRHPNRSKRYSPDLPAIRQSVNLSCGWSIPPARLPNCITRGKHPV